MKFIEEKPNYWKREGATVSDYVAQKIYIVINRSRFGDKPVTYSVAVTAANSYLPNSGFAEVTLKTFEHKDDAEKFLAELVAKLNGKEMKC